ncbi:leucine-rich repeat domain-containing protein [Bullifex porci]|uniref:leucine-rich repeat domain-containing protein n=1 Tax=Bullifex porci TaxID=2606638 RepID=UPI0023F25979|nr:leucine-rich repeat domain-containing protein [Bullifex porci]MDD7255414.1 leucine-rich repeat domain-containing protein [Bullifex porci]MDY2741028.1 leucine-rich repeat domain-containing protein [Bullifex porci]
MKQMKKLMVMLMATMLLVVSCEAPGSLFKDTADTVNVVFQNLKARTTTVSSGSVDSVLIENVYFQYKAEHVRGITIGQTEGWTNLSEGPGLGYTLKLGRGVWNIFLRGFATAEARTEAGTAETENTKAIFDGNLENFSVGDGNTLLAVTADVPLRFTNNTGKGSCTVNVTFDEAYAGVSKKATVRLQSGEFDQAVTLSFDETGAERSKAADFTDVDNGIATITVDYLYDDGTPSGYAGTATTLIMTDMHTTTTATISMDVVKLTVNGRKPEGTVEDNVIRKVFNSVFDIYPDNVADNAIVVGYAENARGDHTPITYPYTIYTSATHDIKGRYKASDLGLVPITVTTRTDLNAYEANKAWWGKTAASEPWVNANTTLGSVRFVDGVTSIGSFAFFNCVLLNSVTIPSSVNSIGSYAFSHCTGLTSITIPDSVKEIGSSAFLISGLTSITIPEGVTSIEDSTFSGCNDLTSITIPSSVTSIGNCAFFGCTKLTSIKIPERVTSIGEKAFSGCSGLTDIYVNQTESDLLDNASVPSTCKIHWKPTRPESI